MQKMTQKIDNYLTLYKKLKIFLWYNKKRERETEKREQKRIKQRESKRK